MTAVTEKHRPGRGPVVVSDAVPIDLTGISDAVDGALAITLCVPDRQEIDLTASRLRGALNLFLVEDLGFGADSETRQMYRDAYRLLELNARPTNDDSPFTAYEHMRELGLLTKRFVDVYRERHPAEACDD